jgi:hypothetical protein
MKLDARLRSAAYAHTGAFESGGGSFAVAGVVLDAGATVAVATVWRWSFRLAWRAGGG